MFRKTLIWTLVTGERHPSLIDDDHVFETSRPIIHELFPGITYGCKTGLTIVMLTYGIPVLQKLFPELKKSQSNEISDTDTIDTIEPFLATSGNEWEKNPRWRKRFKELIAA